MNITTSPDITRLLAEVTWDISGTSPKILVENLCTGNNLAACTFWFVATAPGDLPIHTGSENDPDETGNWTSAELNDNWPRAFNNILWSGAQYFFYLYVKDSAGNIFYTTQSVSICKPAGNTKNSTNTYGLATCLVEVKCADGRVFFQDTTNATYQGLTGVLGSSVLRVIYPVDETGNIPDPFVGANFSTALVPITYSSDNYQFQSSCIYDYDFGDYVHVRIKYQSFNPVNGSPAVRFAVLCNINLCSLFCEVDKLVMSIETGNCANIQEAQQKLNLINPKLWLISMGIQQPLCGVDVPALIEQVKEIGGFDCDCCNAPTGIIPTGGSVIDGYNFEVVTECGDISGTVEKNGNNIQIILSDKTYTFAMCDGSPAETTAFEFRKTVVGCNDQICLYVDVTQLSFDILNTIKTNGDLVNLFNSIVTNSGGLTLTVDGKCVFDNSTSCNYVFTFSNIPVNTTFAIFTGIDFGSIAAAYNFSFNLTNLPAFQTYLNTLGVGTFTVTNPSGQTVLVTSNNNTFGLVSMFYSIAASNFIAGTSKICTGYSPLEANEVVQNIIDYLCTIDDSQVVSSQGYTVCWIDEDGVKQTEIFAAGTELADIIESLTEKGCVTVDYIIGLSGVNCDAIKEIFPSLPENVMQANDYFLGTKVGDCAQILPTEAFLAMLQYGAYNKEVIDAFCIMVDLCAGGNPCDPYNIFFAVVEEGSPSSDLVVTFDNPGDVVSNTIRYGRIDNTVSPVYTTVTGITPGQSPYTISGIENGQYRVFIKPIYADGRSCPETSYDTAPCSMPTSLNAAFVDPNMVINFSVEAGVDFAKINISYPNGGFYSQVYELSTLVVSEDLIYTATIDGPSNVYGTFFVTVQAVCEPGTGFFGPPTAPANFEIPEPSP